MIQIPPPHFLCFVELQSFHVHHVILAELHLNQIFYHVFLALTTIRSLSTRRVIELCEVLIKISLSSSSYEETPKRL
jgi:Cft2 family RNA processing exonuclease